MQHTQDKEFDKLFRDKFVDAEIEPSANLWDKIESELAPKRKHTFPIYWMAAASIAIAFTAMLVFQKTEKIQLRIDDATVSTSNLAKPAMSNTADEVVTNPVQEKVVPTSSVTSTQVASIKTIDYPTSVVTVKNNDEDLQPNETIARLPIKQADPKPIDVLPVAEVESPIVIAQVDPQRIETNQVDDVDPGQERKGIRNVGDIVNYVVDKVDKRDKKLLRFNTDDDDNSSIVGINIGFLKFNKKNR